MADQAFGPFKLVVQRRDDGFVIGGIFTLLTGIDTDDIADTVYPDLFDLQQSRFLWFLLQSRIGTIMTSPKLSQTSASEYSTFGGTSADYFQIRL